jgi:7-keto-8-aminopelargonate synthetase-like enzyme
MTKVNQLQKLHEADLFEIDIIKVEAPYVYTSTGEQIIDYVTTGYLGIDSNTDIIDKGIIYAREWGVISNWSRMELNPVIYTDLETDINKWMKAHNTILGHTITVNNFSVLPYLASDGYIIYDSIVHTVVFEACRLARDHGAKLLKFNHQDLNSLESVLSKLPLDKTKIIAVDGVYSITTEVAPLSDLVMLCERYNAYCYIDDAHGLGIYGENPTVDNIWGQKGNGIWNYFNISKERIFYVSNFGKALGATCAFLCYPDKFKHDLKSNCLQYLFSAPPNPFSIGSAKAALEWNQQHGEYARDDLYQKVVYFINGLKSIGLNVENINHHPVVFLKLGSFDKLEKVAFFLRKKNIIGGYRAYPVVQPDNCGIRFSITTKHNYQILDITCKYIYEALNSI